MPRFYLHQKRGDVYIADAAGEDFASIQDAVVEAVTAAREAMQNDLDNGILDLTQSFEIEWPDGSIVTVRFSGAVQVQL